MFFFLHFAGLTVEEGQSFTITTRQLSGSDESGRLLYEILQPPQLGRIELQSMPGNKHKLFPQPDIFLLDYISNN